MSKKDPLKPLYAIADALNHAERATKLLVDLWMWYGPYGIRDESTPRHVAEKICNDPELLAAWRATKMPDELHNRLRDFFRFDDSE